ncbi:hypothetical protein Ctob_012898 [Chrysochromulina tobinii]|uniref:Uncharacterized protein n=1 Tax=Chrysochromulina tobinii TaxID=1460289 RepID=A0A0M0KC32_9EUKA|nr:hypothetical protein Ctob_012898 [Chrysochromulina tobinii]|eukprot:KOO36142.1 hypothetical protein Ctob_012898 [Chrysochromulina sp. CCMP291]
MKQEEVDASGSRSMRHSDAMLTLRLVLLSGETAQPQQQQQFLVDVSDAICYGELRKLVQRRCGSRLSNSFRLLRLKRSGETVVLDQQTFPNYVLASWCQQPWTIYVQDERNGELSQQLHVEDALDSKSVFALLLSKAVERPMASVLVPSAPNDSGSHVYLDPARGRWIVDTKRFGVRVEIPAQSLLPGARLEVRFFTPAAVGYLMGRGLTRELMYTPIVRVDYPAFKDDDAQDDAERPGIIGKSPPLFKMPLTLVLPHSFDASGGEESCLLMGAAHGATHWAPVHAADDVGSLYCDDLVLDERELRASIPFAGLFCAFAHPHVEVITAVRLHLYMRPEVGRDSPFSLRVYLCPELPTELEELALAEASQWGNSVRVGSSKLLFLCLGAKLRMSYIDDRTGERHDVARKAGIPETGYTVEFETRLNLEMRPDAPVLALLERTPHEFTVVWPKGVPGAVGGEPPPPKDVEQLLLEKARETYFSKQPQHVTDGGWPVAHRIGNAPSRQEWGGNTLLLSAPSSEQHGAVPVPYDVPRLPVRDTAGLAKAGAALAAQYRAMGAEGGGGGLVFGLRVDHVLQAILGTPTANGQYSPRRTLSTLQQPLMAMCEVVYHDVLLPLLDGARVLRSEWQLVGEKMAGIIPRIVSHACYYTRAR